MILSNSKIFEALDDGRLIIDPQPQPRLTSPGGPDSPFNTTSVDLTLGRNLTLMENAPQVALNIERPGVIDSLTALSKQWDLRTQGPYMLERGVFILGETHERVGLPLRSAVEGVARERPTLAARIEGKSSRARVGILVHFTAPTIHSGWLTKTLALEIICLGNYPIMLREGVSICQLILEEVAGEPEEAPSQFQGQVHATGASS